MFFGRTVAAPLHAERAQDPIGEGDQKTERNAGPQIDPAHGVRFHVGVSFSHGLGGDLQAALWGGFRPADAMFAVVASVSSPPADCRHARARHRRRDCRRVPGGRVVAHLVRSAGAGAALHRRARHARRRGQHRRQRRPAWAARRRWSGWSATTRAGADVGRALRARRHRLRAAARRPADDPQGAGHQPAAAAAAHRLRGDGAASIARTSSELLDAFAAGSRRAISWWCPTTPRGW